MSVFSIRPATEADAAWCRTMLPSAFPAIGRVPDLLLAHEGDARLGVAALAWLPHGFPLLVHVEESVRRRGIGTALVRQCIARATGETGGLRNWSPLAEDSDGAALLTACGFRSSHRFQVYEGSAEKLGRDLTALLARVRPRIPAGVRLVRPRDAPRAPVIALIGAHLSLRGAHLEAALFGPEAETWDQSLSLVLLADDAVAGVTLAHRAGDILEVDLNAVNPAWRRGWANLMLTEGVVRGGRDAGLTGLRFMAEPHVQDTINIARRAGAARLPDLVTMILPLET